jgi:hypothetical protein
LGSPNAAESKFAPRALEFAEITSGFVLCAGFRTPALTSERFRKSANRLQLPMCAPKDYFTQRACAAPNIKPGASWRHAKPFYELPGDEAAPASNIGLIGMTTGPYILAFVRHDVIPTGPRAEARRKLCAVLGAARLQCRLRSDSVIGRCRLDVRFARKRTWLGDL